MGPCRFVTFRWLTLLILLTPLLSSTENEITNDVSSSDDVTCASLEVENGAVYRTTDSKLHNIMLIDCHNGFKIQGSTDVTCEDNHISDTTLLPKCVQITTCPVNCATATIEHAPCTPTGENSNKTHVAAGEEVYFSCDGDYSLSTLYDHVTCTSNGTFDRDLPSCVQSGLSCLITDSEAVEYFLEPATIREVPHGSSIEINCKHGYYMRKNNGSMVTTCNRGKFDKDYEGLCAFVGVNVSIDYTTTADDDEIESDDTDNLTFENGVNVTLTCKAYSRSNDGLPFPEVTWVYPSRLRDYVDVHEGDAFVHTEYIASVDQEYRIVYEYEGGAGRYLHQSHGTLTISPTMEVHSGEYTCVVKHVNETSVKTQIIKVKTDSVLAMYFLLILPVVLFIIVHCFYRQANTMNPFPAHNKLTRDMMQEVDKKKKLEELRANPAYQKKYSGATPSGTSGGDRNTRGRRGAVVDI